MKPIDDPAVKALAHALTTPDRVNFDSVYVADQLRADVAAVHAVAVLRERGWAVVPKDDLAMTLAHIDTAPRHDEKACCAPVARIRAALLPDGGSDG